jgi:crotonobetainyl-CoA:carnitine CoA-transferase CaiB-like acyl-CoA transferase
MFPLQGLRVLDLSRLLPGPLCSMILADLGAEVIKIEAPELGDYLRWDAPRVTPTQGVHFAALNRNKRSAVLDLKSDGGRAVFLRLVQGADVVIEGFRPSRLEQLGVGYAVLSATNPRLIYCAISGYGQTGPDSERAGHDLNFLARAGLLDLCGSLPPVQIADIAGAYLAAIGVLAAVAGRAASGRGQLVDVSLLDAVWPFLLPLLPPYWLDGRVPRRGALTLGGAWPCYNVYECADGRAVALGALEPGFWRAFLERIERLDLLDGGQVAGPAAEPVFAALRALFKTRPRADWLALFADLDVCFEPVLTFEEAASDPQARARGLRLDVEQPGAGRIGGIGLPLRLSAIEQPRAEPSPEFGADTAAVLREAGYADDEIARLGAQGAIGI